MRGKAFTQAEDDVIRLMRAKGSSIRQIAHYLGRGKSSVLVRLQRMEREGTAGQSVFDMGQAGDKSEQ